MSHQKGTGDGAACVASSYPPASGHGLGYVSTCLKFGAKIRNKPYIASWGGVKNVKSFRFCVFSFSLIDEVRLLGG